MDLATATIKAQRSGENPNYGTFDVLTVEFDEAERNPKAIAANLQQTSKPRMSSLKPIPQTR
jgi:hypothetical protein